MLEDCDIDLVEVLLRFSNGATTLENTGQSIFNDLSFLTFTYEPASSCGPDEKSTCIIDQTFNGLLARPVRFHGAFLPDKAQIIFQEDLDIMVYDYRRYVVKYKILVFSFR